MSSSLPNTNDLFDTAKIILSRSVGKWRSYRRYLFLDQDHKCSNMIQEFEIIERSEGIYNIKTAHGFEMNVELAVEAAKLILRRDRNYVDNSPGTESPVHVIDNNTILVASTYGSPLTTYREEIRLVGGDNYRQRQTVGCLTGTTDPVIVGQYWEERLS